MRSLPYSLAALVATSAFGCTNDLRAPSNYLVSDDSSDTSGGVMLMVDCGMPNLAAVGADYSFTPSVMGGDGNYKFAFADPSNPPAGLTIDSKTGEISGVPEMEGSLDFDIDVTDGSMGSGSDTCSITVNPHLGVNLDVKAPGCVSGSQSLLDKVVDGTGDGTKITCAFNKNRGDGLMPTGQSIDPDSCEIVGGYQDQFFGTWVFIVQGSQSGAHVYVPYCITNDMLPDGVDMRITHSGGENTLTPFIGQFNPNASSFAIGDGAGEPHFEVEDDTACGANSCNYEFHFLYSSSNFNDVDCPSCNGGKGLDDLVINDQLLKNQFDESVGLQHDLRILKGRDLDASFADRPWVLNLRFNYCIADNQAACTGAAFDSNVVGRMVFSTLMFPEGT